MQHFSTKVVQIRLVFIIASITVFVGVSTISWGNRVDINNAIIIGGSVAAWLSEKVLRGRGPDASGFESHRRGRIFSKEGTSARPWMCVYVYQGLTVGWWKEESTLFRPPPRGQHGFESRREGCPWVYKCCCVCL
jgi:hypothetical protein